MAAREEAVEGTLPGSSASTARVSGTVADWIRLIRPRQWIKNAFVLAPLLFSGFVVEPEKVLAAFAAFLLFCMLASGIYCWNDVVDREADRLHPTKRNRPIAAGRIRPGAALGAGLGMAAAALVLGMALDPVLGVIFAVYLALNVAYTYRLKHVVLLDVFAIAAFFLLRLLAGAAAIEADPSVWLLLCGGLLSLYLGFAKRRHELLLMGDDSVSHRSVLAQYTAPLLDQIAVVLLAVTIVAYIMYTLTSQTATQVGTETLSYSTIFVLYGVLRYLYLTHEQHGGDPAETLLTDRSLLTAVALWLAYCGWAIYRPF